MNVRYSYIIVIILLTSFWAKAQPDCRSSLAGHLKPFAENFPLSWAVEGTGSYGISDHRDVANAMLFAGLDFTKAKHQLYAEGGYKGFRDSWSYPGAENLGEEYWGFGLMQKNKLGMRELFYKYNESGKFNITAGLHSMRSADFFLVNERMIGVSGAWQKGALSLNFYGGSVSREFVGMGNFCSVRYIYNVFPMNGEIQASTKIGVSNLGGMVLLWDRNYVKPAENKNSDEFKPASDEFKPADYEFKSTTDEFKSVDPVASGDKSTGDKKIFEKLGLVLHNEFSLEKHGTTKWFAGGLAQIQLPLNIAVKFEALQQIQTANNSVGIYATLLRDFSFGNQRTELSVGTMAKMNISDSAVFSPAYSNLWLGEELRLDTWNAPLYWAGVKHSFPGKAKPYIRLRGLVQPNGYHVRTIDLEAGCKATKNIRITGIGSYITADQLVDPYWFLRLEIRITI